MAQILLHLPDELIRRFKRSVPARQRSRFVGRLLEEALPSSDDDPLYRAALEVEQDEALNAEMAEWEVTVGDGLEHVAPWTTSTALCSAPDLAARLGKDPKAVRRVLRALKIPRRGSSYALTPADCERVAARFDVRR